MTETHPDPIHFDPRLALLLRELPALTAGRVREQTGETLTLARVLDEAMGNKQVANQEIEGRPFLVELARRVLALGYLAGPPDGDRLLDPWRSPVDSACTDGPLALARALTAVELQDAALLATIVARHLRWRAGETEAGRPLPVWPWLAPLLEDVSAQCLLVGAFAPAHPEPGDGERAWLLNRLVFLHEQEPLPLGPLGPLAACCALGALLRRPRDRALLRDFKERVTGWSGWRDPDRWPTRPPGGGLAEFMSQLTERIAEAVGAAARKPWSKPPLERLLEGCWPPLLSFCVPAVRGQGE